MKNRFLFVLFGVLSIWVFPTAFAAAGFQDFLKNAQKLFETTDSISESEIVEGLKQALEIRYRQSGGSGIETGWLLQ
jgi:hypothetical protein